MFKIWKERKRERESRKWRVVIFCNFSALDKTLLSIILAFINLVTIKFNFVYLALVFFSISSFPYKSYSRISLRIQCTISWTKSYNVKCCEHRASSFFNIATRQSKQTRIKSHEWARAPLLRKNRILGTCVNNPNRKFLSQTITLISFGVISWCVFLFVRCACHNIAFS